MPINEGKLNPGIEYQFLVIAYTAACLSEKKDVEDFEIYTNHNDVPGFDDIIVKVKYKSQSQSFVYMGQIKRYKKIKIDLNKGDERLEVLLQHIAKVKDKENRKPFLASLLEDVPEENMEFWYFSNSFLKNPSKGSILLCDGTECHLQGDTTHKSIFPVRNTDEPAERDATRKSINPSQRPVTCYKISAGEKYSSILNKFNFYLNQPDHDKIPSRIVALNSDLFSIKTANNICNYVYMYLRKCRIAKITKHVFETELLRLCLSSFTVSPTKAIKIDPQIADIWNELVLQYHTTVINNTSTQMKPYIFGCLWRNIMKLYDCTFNWNELITDFKKFGKIIANSKFINLSKATKFRHWLFNPDTIEDFLNEMWKSDYLPMVLSSDTKMSILEKYKHLSKHFIILDNKEEVYNEISNLDLRTFANAADIYELELGREFLKKIHISLQGREPVDIFSIVNDDIVLLKELKCDHLLHLIEEKRLFLKEQAILETDSAIFIIADDSNTANQIDINFINGGSNENVIICRSSEVDYHTERVRDNPRTKECLIYNLRVNDGRLELTKGEKFNLRKFIVDGNGNDLYFHNDQVFPIIGNRLENDGKYIDRYLRKPTIEPSIFDLENKIVFFLTGNLESSRYILPNQNEIIQEGSLDYAVSRIKAKLEKDQNAFVAIPYIENIWSRFLSKEHALLHVKLENCNMLLLKQQNCQNLGSYISYKGAKFNQKSFFEETSTGITVITGEPGAGKSTLLRSLYKACGRHKYALFSNLNDYRQSLWDRNAELFENPLKFLFKKEAKQSTFSNNKYSIYDNYLNFLLKLLERQSELIVFLDSFDEILPVCQKEVLDFIKMLNKSNVRLIIASRLVMTDILVNSLEVNPIKIEILDIEDVKDYTNGETLTENNLNNCPPEFIENPMYLNFLITLHRENSLPATITRSSLYHAIIEKHIERFYNKKTDFYTPTQYEYLKKDILDIHKSLAIVEVFDDATVRKLGLNSKQLMDYCIQSDKIKLGLIIKFNDDRPVFLHRTFTEFLVAEWLSENIDQDHVKEIYKMLFHDRKIHITHILDDILCENLSLHKAILAADLISVEKLCSEGDNYLEQMDKLNRPALHLACSYSKHNEDRKKNYLILETIVRHMNLKGMDFKICDSINWTWLEYLEFNDPFLYKACRLDLTYTLEMYFVCQKRMKEGIIYTLNHNSLNATMALLKRNISLLSKFFDEFVTTSIVFDRFNLTREIIELQNKNNSSFNILHKACTNLSSVPEVSACINLKIYGGFTAMHIACLYDSVEVVKELLKLGAKVNVEDNFKLRPLCYAVLQDSSEIVSCLAKYKPLALSKPKAEGRFIFKLFKIEIFPITLYSLEFYKLIIQPYLHISVFKNYLEIAEILLENGFDINQKNNYGKTALHIAIENNFGDQNFILPFSPYLTNLKVGQKHDMVDKIKLLLKYNPDCNIEDNLGNMPLHMAARNNLLILTQLLLQHGAEVNLKHKNFLMTPLEIAVKSGSRILTFFKPDKPLGLITERRYSSNYIDVIEELLKAGANVNHINVSGDTVLHTAIQCNYENLAEILLAYGADVDIEDADGHTPLHVAVLSKCFHNTDNNAKLLLEAGANVNHKNNRGEAILHTAARCAHANFVKILLAYGADVDIEDEDAQTPLHVAIACKYSNDLTADVTQILLEAGANINHKSKYGHAALHIAVLCDYEDLVEILLTYGADVDVENRDGDSALCLALGRCNIQIIRMLLKKGADINHRNKYGNSALQIAVISAHEDIVNILLHNGADTNAVNNEGQTAMSIAKVYKNKTAVELLSKYEQEP